MDTSPLPYVDLSYQVYERLKQMILSNELKPGEKIVQERIAGSLGISRMPLHKAFQMLENEFLVESIPRRGIFVKKPDIREIMEAFECREGLEGVAARRAADNIPLEKIHELREKFTAFQNIKSINKIEYQHADQDFHESIMEASQNRILQKLNRIGSVLIRTYPKGIILPLEESIQDHLLILEAFESRDSKKAEKLIRSHSRKARIILEKQLEQSNKL